MSTFTCPRCAATSHHPKDAEQGYCGRCHDFTVAALIASANHLARLQRNALSLWTVYDHPPDYAVGYIARRFEYDQPTADVVTGELAMIRNSMQHCGLVCLTRAEADDARIVETWL